jgi:hypothetical protein
VFSLVRRLMFCVFVSIQFCDKIVLIVICESLNRQYPLFSNLEVHQMIESRRGIYCDQHDIMDDLISNPTSVVTHYMVNTSDDSSRFYNSNKTCIVLNR